LPTTPVASLDRAGHSAGETPEGFDVIIDTVAGPDMVSFFGKLQDNGRMVVCGAAGGFPAPDFGQGLLLRFKKSPTLSLFSLDTIDVKERAAAMKELFDWTSQGRLKPVIHDTLPLENASAAHTRLEAGEAFGKLVLAPSER
jgi:NADPH:quinone reductase-like Zn-dependent oxidoreductase